VGAWIADMGVGFDAAQERFLKTRAGVHSIAFSPDGTLVAAGGLYGDVNIFSVTSGEGTCPLGILPAELPRCHLVLMADF